MELNNSEKVNAVISLSNRAYDETKRYRDHIWKVLVWTIGLLVGVLAAANTRPDIVNAYTRYIGSIFIVIISGFGIWNIHFDYKNMVWNRNLLRKCERILQLHKENAYGENETLLPKGWDKSEYKLKNCLPHYVQWVIVIFAITIYSIYALCSLDQLTYNQKERQELLLTRTEKLIDRAEEITKKHETLFVETKKDILMNIKRITTKQEGLLHRYEKLVEQWEDQKEVDKTVK